MTTIKLIKTDKNTAVVAYFIMLTCAVCIVGMLLWQYVSFTQEIEELQLVKESYGQHIAMLQRSLNGSLSESSLEESTSEDEPDDLDIKKIEIPFQKTSSNLVITSVDQEDVVIKNGDQDQKFALITPEEEYRLTTIKKRSKKVKSRSVGTRKKNKDIKTGRQIRRSHRYTSICDYSFAWPIELSKFWLSSLYGPRRLSNRRLAFHHGIDMAGVKGTPVKASAVGKVVCACSVSGYGNCVDIMHSDRYKTRYAHLNSIRVRVGQQVETGQVVGTVGSTGFVHKSGKDASHLHFEIHQDGHTVNPLRFLFL